MAAVLHFARVRSLALLYSGIGQPSSRQPKRLRPGELDASRVQDCLTGLRAAGVILVRRIDLPVLVANKKRLL